MFNRVDPEPLINALRSGLVRFGISEAAIIRVYRSLEEVSSAEYFYEGLLAFAWKSVPYGKRSYPLWKRKMRLAIVRGKEIVLIGKISSPPRKK